MTESKHLSDLELQGLLDGALKGHEARQAQAHLETCRDCARRAKAEAQLFAAIEAWGEPPPPHDLAPRIVAALAHRKTPVALRVATVVEAALALLIALLAWPLVSSLFSSWKLPTLSGFEFGLSEALAIQIDSGAAAIAGMAQQVSVSLDAGLRAAAEWMPLWPAIVAGALLLAVLGNSVLLAGDRGIRARRL